MLAIFLDAQLEIKEIKREVEVLRRKRELFEKTKNPEIKDSHIRAMAGCVHSVYTGIENILKSLIKYFDKELPVGDDWHIQLLVRAKNENPDIRKAILSEETFRVLNEIRGFRHIFRGKYHSLLIPKKVIERADEALKAYSLFLNDLKTFIKETDPSANANIINVVFHNNSKGL